MPLIHFCRKKGKPTAPGLPSHCYFYRKVKKDFPHATREKVREFLRTQDTYTKTFPKGGPGLGKKSYRKTMVGKLGQQLQMDLVIMSVVKTEKGREMKEKNDGYQNILTSIEVLSRFAFTKPLKTKTGEEVSEAMSEILDEFKKRFGDYPEFVQFDDCSEF